MTSQLVFAIRDYSDEISTLSINIPTVNAANFDSMVTLADNLQTAIAGMTKGNIVKRHINVGLTAGADERPSDPYAQREIGLRLFYQDDVNGQKQHVTIACADLDVMAQGGTDDIDLTASLAAALVTAFEAMVVSRDGNAITVNRGRVVGRSS